MYVAPADRYAVVPDHPMPDADNGAAAVPEMPAVKLAQSFEKNAQQAQ